jgi:tetratricopeptide (TPR) repeat protein
MQIGTASGSRRLAWALFFLVVMGIGRGGSAQAAPPLGKGGALVQRGEAALASGDLPAAEQAFVAAYRQDPRADLLYQLGQLAAAQGQLLTAQDLLRRYLNDPTATADAAKAAAAQKVLAQPRPPSGKVRVQGDRGGFVLIDGRLLGRLPLVQPLLAAPGAHTVAIQYPGKALDVPVDVLAGRMVDIRCTRATGAIVLSMLPALLVLPELGDLAAPTAEALLDAVERAAQGEQLTLLKPDAVTGLAVNLSAVLRPPAGDGRAVADLRECVAQLACLQRLLQTTKLEYALRVRVSRRGATGTEPAATAAGESAAGAPWELSVELLHASIFGPASAHTQTCAACSEQKAAALLQDAVGRTLAEGRLRPRGTLAVTSQPAGAEVWHGDHLLGKTPLSRPAWAGEYELTLRLSGHEPVQRTMKVEAGKTTELAANLPALAPPPSPPSMIAPPPPPPPPPRWERAPRPRWRIAAGAAALIAGVGLTIGGIYELGLNFPPQTCAPPPPMAGSLLLIGCSPDYRDAAAQATSTGAALTTVGSALTLTGIGLLAVPGPRRQVPATAAPKAP